MIPDSLGAQTQTGQTQPGAAQNEPMQTGQTRPGAREEELERARSVRTRLLIGDEAYAALQKSLVVVAGLGGVGGHCAEALARAGMGRLHLIDFDAVTVSNLNRQLVATKRTLGMQKTAAMAARLAEVSTCAVTCFDGRLAPDTVARAVPADADFIVDAIDSVSGKTALAVFARQAGIPILACMGAGNRLDPTQFFITDLFATSDDPLARRMRHELRRCGLTALPVVCSHERAHVAPGQREIGSLAPVTAAAGLCAAGYALARLTRRGEGTT